MLMSEQDDEGKVLSPLSCPFSFPVDADVPFRVPGLKLRSN